MTICTDFYAGNPGLIPRRIRRANPRALANRWVNFVLSFDLTPEPDDNSKYEMGAWSIWDLPVNVSAQIDDATGDDLIVVASANRIFILDWERFRDEWNWEVYGKIYRRLTFGPLPSSAEAVDKFSNDANAYRLDYVRRFREVMLQLNTLPTAIDTAYRATVNEINKYDRFRQGQFAMTQRNRAHVAFSNAITFEVTIEHEANEQFDPTSYLFKWDSVGKRLRTSDFA